MEGLFQLAHAPRSRLLLVGIANSIDLVQQLLKPGGALHVSRFFLGGGGGIEQASG